MKPEVVRIPSLAYLRSVLAIAWGAFRHPFLTTYVDLLTGEAVHVQSGVAPGWPTKNVPDPSEPHT